MLRTTRCTPGGWLNHIQVVLLIILIITGISSFGQALKISGQIKDSRSSINLKGATVQLLKVYDERDSISAYMNFMDTLYSLIEETTTNSRGIFNFKRLTEGNYTIWYEKTLDSIGRRFDKMNIILTRSGHQKLSLHLPYICSFSKDATSTCPFCNKNDQVIPVFHGLPDEEMFRKSEAGTVKLGGCSSDIYCSAGYYCKRDKRYY
jgi:hypothetical protein